MIPDKCNSVCYISYADVQAQQLLLAAARGRERKRTAPASACSNITERLVAGVLAQGVVDVLEGFPSRVDGQQQLRLRPSVANLSYCRAIRAFSMAMGVAMNRLQTELPLAGDVAPKRYVKVHRTRRPPRPWVWAIYEEGRSGALQSAAHSYRSAAEAWEVGCAMISRGGLGSYRG